MSPSKTPALFSLFFLVALFGLFSRAAVPAHPDPPRGRFVELHSCEVFAGPCVINSEVDQEGNYLLSVWQFDQGSLQGVPLRGLTVALLEKGGESLAVPANRASDAVAYLPPGLSPAQRSALLAWAQRNTAVKLDRARVKVAPMHMTFAGNEVRFALGRQAAFTAGAPAACTTGNSCGAMLWYQPRSAASSFVVDQLGQSRIVEPLLSLRWMDHGRRTLFVGRFGDPEPTVPALCGAPVTASL